MSSRFRFPKIAVIKSAAVVGAYLLAGTISCLAQPLLVCADPQNAPFSDREKTGFDNRIAEVIGADLHRPVRFYWARKGRGFVREVVNKGSCDVLIDIPVGAHGLLISKPLYRSTYVFVTRRSSPAITSLDDPNLRRMKIGVQILGDGYAPPAQALARRGLSSNIVGYDMDRDTGTIVSAVRQGKVDAAIVWGPIAGYYTRRSSSLRISPVTPEVDPPVLPFTFAMAIGVRRSEPALLAQINQAISRESARVHQILEAYNIPVLALNAGEGAARSQSQTGQ
jgi:mxaJ protein